MNDVSAFYLFKSHFAWVLGAFDASIADAKFTYAAVLAASTTCANYKAVVCVSLADFDCASIINATVRDASAVY